MAATRSVGSLFIDIEARVAQLEQDFAKAKATVNEMDRTVKGHGDQWQKTGKQIENSIKGFALTLVLGGNLVNRLALEFRDVAQNIEKIPGVRPEVVASVQELRANLNEAHQELQVAIADVEGFFLQVGKSIGTTIGAMVYGWDAVDEALKPVLLSLDDIARAQDKAYDAKIVKAQQEIVDMRRKEKLSTMELASQIRELRLESAREMAESKSKGINTLEQLAHQKKGIEELIQANEKYKTLKKELDGSSAALIKAENAEELTHLSTRQQLLYTERLIGVEKRYQQSILEHGDIKDPAVMEQMIESNKRLLELTNEHNAALRKQKDYYRELATAVTNDFGEAILQGEHLDSLLNRLLGDLLKIILQREVLAPAADWLSLGFKGLFGGGAAGLAGGASSAGISTAGATGLLMSSGLATGGPISGPRLVGEDGPEIFDPGGYGNIIPNGQLRSGDSGNTYVIDARGTDESVVQRLAAALQQLAGPGVVERRAVGAVQQAKARRGGNGSAL